MLPKPPEAGLNDYLNHVPLAALLLYLFFYGGNSSGMVQSQVTLQAILVSYKALEFIALWQNGGHGVLPWTAAS
jgi:hypothetical protein